MDKSDQEKLRIFIKRKIDPNSTIFPRDESLLYVGDYVKVNPDFEDIQSIFNNPKEYLGRIFQVHSIKRTKQNKECPYKISFSTMWLSGLEVIAFEVTVSTKTVNPVFIKSNQQEYSKRRFDGIRIIRNANYREERNEWSKEAIQEFEHNRPCRLEKIEDFNWFKTGKLYFEFNFEKSLNDSEWERNSDDGYDAKYLFLNISPTVVFPNGRKFELSSIDDDCSIISVSFYWMLESLSEKDRVELDLSTTEFKDLKKSENRLNCFIYIDEDQNSYHWHDFFKVR